MRTATENRKTNETDLLVQINIDGTGQCKVDTGIGFFDHMLFAFAKYSMVDLEISAKGDLQTGTHHTIEDVGIVLGTAIANALGDKRGISRAGFFIYVMDDALVEVTIDLSGRGRLIFEKNGQELKFSGNAIGGVPTDEIKEFFWALADNMKANISIRLLRPGNTHHEIEATFKAFGKALRMATEKDQRAPNTIPSTKGVI